MSPTYLNIAQTFFRKAVIVIDKFHVVQHLMEAVDDCRKRKQSQLKKHKDLIYQLRHAFCKTFKKLGIETQQKLDELFNLDPELKIIHDLKEEFLAIYADENLNRTEAETTIAAWIERVKTANIPELLEFVTTYERRKEHILNYFDYRYTNGLMEGLNNKNKVIQRMSYGFRTFATLRGKLLFELSMS
jgi:transposase